MFVSYNYSFLIHYATELACLSLFLKLAAQLAGLSNFYINTLVASATVEVFLRASKAPFSVLFNSSHKYSSY
nr:MAG TPA: hypothetical protein [Crassvirales sp.]